MSPLNLCFYILFYVFLLSLFTRLTSALFIYDKRTLLDIGHRCTNLLQDTLSTDPAWPAENLRNAEVNKGHPNNPRRRKKHRGRRAGIRDRLRKKAHSPPLPSILLANSACLYFPADRSYYKKKVNFGHAIPFSTSRGKMEGCERCPLSPSID